jgi:hypothetical protein
MEALGESNGTLGYAQKLAVPLSPEIREEPYFGSSGFSVGTSASSFAAIRMGRRTAARLRRDLGHCPRPRSLSLWAPRQDRIKTRAQWR